MARNIFKVARRAAYVTAGLWALGFAIAVLIVDREDLTAHFIVVSPDRRPLKVYKLQCGMHDKEEWGYRTTSAGTKVRVTLCFRARRLKDGQMLVPFRTSGHEMEGGLTYSTPVQEYADRVMREFSLSKSDEELLDSQYRRSRLELAWVALQWIVGGWVMIWIITAGVGIVVRAVKGIPHGHDHRRGSRRRNPDQLGEKRAS